MPQERFTEEIKVSFIGMYSKKCKGGKVINSISFVWLFRQRAFRIISLKFYKLEDAFDFLNKLQQRNGFSSFYDLQTSILRATIEYESNEDYNFKNIQFGSDLTWNKGYIGAEPAVEV